MKIINRIKKWFKKFKQNIIEGYHQGIEKGYNDYYEKKGRKK